MSKFDYIIEKKKRSNFNNLRRVEKSMARKKKKSNLSMKLVEGWLIQLMEGVILTAPWIMLSIFILSLLLLKCL